MENEGYSETKMKTWSLYFQYFYIVTRMPRRAWFPRNGQLF